MFYDLNYFVFNFMCRTIANYKYINKEDIKEDNEENSLETICKNGPYEVTQLINSLFGLIILPSEYYKLKNESFQNVKKYEDKLKNVVIHMKIL